MLATLSVLAVSAVLITKAADLWTTWKYVGAERESNPIGRLLFRRLGVPGGLAVVGVVALGIVVTSWSAAWAMGDWAVVFVAAWSFVIAAVQAGVAHHNATGRSNFITVRVAALHGAWARAAARHGRGRFGR